VVKPVARALRDLALFSGNTILGDGSVVMILDPNGIVMASGNDAVEQSDSELEARGDGNQAETSSLLLFRSGEGAPKAFPLELVARIEEIDLSGVETANGGPVIQYREGLMPLALIDGAAPLGSEGRRPVLVFSDLDRSLGLVVDEIVDIVDHRIEFESQGNAPGILGSTIIEGQATDLLDAGHYLKSFGGDWLSRSKSDGAAGDAAKRRILLVEDSPFFRNLLTPLLQSAGYDVCATENADQALVVLEEQPEFDVIVSDIEMPGMSGLEFATKLRSSEAWKDTPLLALSSHDTQQDIDRGIEAGFDEYIAKADHSALIDVLSRSANPVKNAA